MFLNLFQSAFRPCHFIETALTNVANDILLTTDSNSISALLMLDLSAAFDTVFHCILLNRLENDFGMSGLALTWLKSFCKNTVCFL